MNEIELGLLLIRNLLQKKNFENGNILIKCNFVESLLNILNSCDSPSIQTEATLCLIEICESISINSNESLQQRYIQTLFDYNIVNIIENITIKTTDNNVYSLATILIALLNSFNNDRLTLEN